MDITSVIRSLKSPPVTGWTKSLVWHGTVSAFVGVILGMIISLIVNVALVEISVSPFFGLYFGIIFIFTGAVIAWRVSGTPVAEPESKDRQKIFMILAAIVSFSGLICCFIQRGWFFAMPKVVRVPIYSLIGSSITFALIFSTIDLLNVAFGLCALRSNKSPIESSAQVILIVSSAIIMGSIFGLIFGLLDVANEVSYHVRLSLLRDEEYCYPIGGIFGGLVGFANAYLQSQEEGYVILKRAEYDADI